MRATAIDAIREIGPKMLLTLVLAAWPAAPGHAGDSLVGKVVAVKSGNLLTLDYGRGTQEVRLAGIEIDTGESASRAAKDALSNMLLGKTVRLRFDGYLPNGEMSGRLLLGGIGRPEEAVRDVGVELVRAGTVRSAKAYREYKYGQMERAESEARQSRRGLWRNAP